MDDEVDFPQWKYHAKHAQQYFSPEAVRTWIYKSLRGAALQTVLNLDEGTPTIQILSMNLWFKYGSILSFDDLMKTYLNVAQSHMNY